MVKAALEGGWLPLLHSVTKNDAKNDNRDQKSEPPPLHVPDRVRRILERTKLTDGYLTAVSARLFNSTRSKRFMRAATLQGFDIVLDIKGMQALPATEAKVGAAADHGEGGNIGSEQRLSRVDKYVEHISGREDII